MTDLTVWTINGLFLRRIPGHAYSTHSSLLLLAGQQQPNIHSHIPIGSMPRKIGVVTRDEVVGCLGSDGEKRSVRITFSGGVVQLVDISCVDEEGILHSGPDGTQPQGYWTRFEDISAIEDI